MGRFSLLCALVAALVATGCNRQEPAPQAAASPPPDPGLVQAPEALQAQLKIGPVAAQPVKDVLRVAGRIDFDEQRVARIGASVTGRVTEIFVLPGQAVEAGRLLARLHSTELSNAQLAYLKARSQAELLQQAASRAQQLYAADVIGRAELQRRDNELAVARIEQRAAHDQLRVLGMSEKEIARLSGTGAIHSASSVVSTLAGTVVERKVTVGQVVQPADALFTVANLSRVWAIAQVPEQQAGQIRPGQQMHIEVPALGNGDLTGKLIYVGETVNPESRTVVVRTEIDNADRRLKPAMLATMLIETRPVDRLVVPTSAVVREENEERVFVENGAGRYRLVPVKLGDEHGGFRPVVSGLKAGDRVVVEGAFHLNNERKRKELE